MNFTKMAEVFLRDTLVDRARAFAQEAHREQKRKYTGEPYSVHCAEVAELVGTIGGGSPEMVAAAYLHDVVEDTPFSQEDITREFGQEISTLVYFLTDKSKPSDGNRAARKAIDREHIAQAPQNAKIIKLADLISNTKSIASHDPDFAKVYLKEKELLLPLLECPNPLYALACQELVQASLLLLEGKTNGTI